ncbi:CHAT domain-containing protein [Streptomyces sp. NPDC056600]|uniref:CHAT domain-containing protein n=1 Tax=Streptomyces sp. NPDC056600 TaxID=3345874 RepID=UPI003678FFF3
MPPTPFDDEIARYRREAAQGSVNAMIDLAMCLRDRYRHTGEGGDLLEAVDLLRQVLRYLEPYPERHVVSVNLSAVLLSHFHAFQDLTALLEAVRRLDRAVPWLTGEDRITAELLRAETLTMLGEETRDVAHVHAAAESLSPLPRDPAVLEVLGRVVDVRYQLTRDHAALLEAVGPLADGVRTVPADDPRRPGLLGALGSVLLHSADHTGDESVRADAIAHLREAVARTPAEDEEAAYLRISLAVGLRDRGRDTGDVAALRESVTLLREVLDATAATARLWGNRCENYLVAVHQLVQQTGDLAILDTAVALGKAARGLGTARPMARLLLGLLLHDRYRCTGLDSDLADAVTAFTEVVELEPYGSPDHVAALGNLGTVWSSKYRSDDDPEALRRAVTALGTAVRATAPASVQRAEAQTAHGDALYAQYELGRDPAVLAAAAHAYRETVAHPSAPSMLRIKAARAWASAEAEAGNWQEATDAYALAVDLLPLVVPRRLARADQQRMLEELDGLAADAAAAALWAGDPQEAVLLLEFGRGMLGGQILESRSDLSRLRAVAPSLADRLRDAFDGLAPTGHLVGTDVDERHARDLLLSDLLEQARALPGFEDFLAPPDHTELLAVAADGPVVLINVSRYRSDALIVRPTGVTVVELPGLGPDTVQDRAAAFGAALDASTRPGRGEAEAQTVVTEVLAWLWDAVAGPVLRRLGHLAPPSGAWPRVWWSPVGRLASLPIHAAGRRPGSATVLDRVISSYTPTLRALRHAREKPRGAVGAAGDEGDGLLVVGLKDAPGGRVLRGVEREVDTVAAMRPATRLEGPRATVASVRAALTSHASVHFACHAVNDPEDPSAGYLLMHDGPLSLLDVSALDLSGARLAVLSACGTSLGAHRIPDESLHLVSAFQLAGHPQVVGTLWKVNDLVARLVAQDLHAGLRVGQDAATALHHAVLRCRERFGTAPTLWAAYLCSGR